MASKLHALFLLSLAPAFALAACQPDKAPDTAIRAEAIGAAAENALIADSQAAGLTAVDAAGNVVPAIAQSWRISRDGRGIVFRLRDATFADGSAITAEDVVRSLNAARRQPATPALASLLTGIRDVTAPLDGVVAIELTTPQPELLELLSIPELAIRKRQPGEDRPLQAGPYRIRPPKGADPVTELLPNAHFHLNEPPAQAISLRRSAAADAVRHFNANAADLVLGGGWPALADARVTSRRGTLIVERPRALWLLLVNARDPLLGKREVRQALQMAINRQALSEDLYATAAPAPAHGLSPTNIPGYAPPEPEWAAVSFVARQMEAGRLLDAALEVPASARHLQLEVAISSDPTDSRLMNAIAADLSAIGVDLKLLRRSPEGRAEAIAAGDFQLALVEWQTPTDSPLPFLQPFTCAANRHGICVPDADHMLEESWQAETFAERLAYLQTAEWLWTREAVAISLVQPVRWALLSPRLTGVVANRAARHPLLYVQPLKERPLLP